MNTKHFESVFELAKTSNFNRAAENLYITQPALTYQINVIEEEIGFRLFDRSGKGAILTPAGEQFLATLHDIDNQLKRAIEQGQNFAFRYRDNITIGMSVRSALYHLPKIIKDFRKKEPSISITPLFNYYNYLNSFLSGETDILFSTKAVVKHIPDIRIHDLYDSHIYLVCQTDDPLVQKKLIVKEDLKGRTLMIGGGSPAPLKKLQQEIISDPSVSYFNSNDHDTSLTFVASGEAIVLSPGFLNDHNPEFRWIPFDCDVRIPCVLCTHKTDERRPVQELTRQILEFYKDVKDV
ncbi:MAG: LysR family transcriptional regulator [Erysipelotrichaceae bacterium]|nr:LysR family transcriptional regulator [Erysipelotrichaceae bacterium]